MKSWKQWHISANIERIKSLASYTQNTDTSLSEMGRQRTGRQTGHGAGAGGSSSRGGGSGGRLSPPGGPRHADPRAGSRGAESGRGEEDRRRRRRAGEEGDRHCSGLGARPQGLRLLLERSTALPHAEPRAQQGGPTGQPPGAQGRGLQAAPMLPAWEKLAAEKAFPALPCSSWPCPTAEGGVRSCCCCHNQMG